jgi:predicted AlkP superfamily phosphohydrolase/phosphomutase
MTEFERDSNDRRLLIVGWDGADWDILRPMMDAGLLPTVASMVGGGLSGTLVSTLPTHSWAAWATFLTGLEPAGHGVFDFVERHPEDPQRRVPVSAASIKAMTFLEVLSEGGVEVRAANIPVTYPPMAVRGRMIGGVAIPRGASFVHPPEWAAELQRRAPFPINGLEWNDKRGTPDALLDDAERLIEDRTASFSVLLEGAWSVGACVYLAPDRLQHPFGASLLRNHPGHDSAREGPVAERLRAIYGRLDASLGRLIDTVGSEATVVLMSDHGFRPVTRTWSVDRLLVHLGFARRNVGRGALERVRRSATARSLARTRFGEAMKYRMKAPSGVDWDRALAYESTIDGGISLNLKGREPHGIVDPNDSERICAEVREALLQWRDPDTGERVVDRVWLRHELPPGPHADAGPDLIAETAGLHHFGHPASLVVDTMWPSGDHRREGVLVAAGPGVPHVGSVSHHIADLAPTALAFAGVPLPMLDGTAIAPIAGREIATTGASAAVDRVSQATDISAEDEDYVAEHLRGLGYIE